MILQRARIRTSNKSDPRSCINSLVRRQSRVISTFTRPGIYQFNNQRPTIRASYQLARLTTHISDLKNQAVMADRYQQVHEYENLNGPGDGRPTAQQIINDNNMRGALTDKVVLITGCSSGIGIETARAMSTTGAKIYVTVRNLKKGQEALSDLLESPTFNILTCDQNSLESVEACAKEFLSKESKLNILINNAGIMANPTRDLTKDGHEAQFGVNHLAHFLLFQRLKSILLSSATPSFPSRVVNLSSSGHRVAPINFDDYRFDNPDSYGPWKAYGQSKTANIYMANEIERRYAFQDLHAFALHPGGIWTGLQIHMGNKEEISARPEVKKQMKSVEQGAATTVWAAVGKELEGKGGIYLDDCQIARPQREGEDRNRGMSGYAKWAYNPEGEARLWKDSCEMLGIKDD